MTMLGNVAHQLLIFFRRPEPFLEFLFVRTRMAAHYNILEPQTECIGEEDELDHSVDSLLSLSFIINTHHNLSFCPCTWRWLIGCMRVVTVLCSFSLQIHLMLPWWEIIYLAWSHRSVDLSLRKLNNRAVCTSSSSFHTYMTRSTASILEDWKGSPGQQESINLSSKPCRLCTTPNTALQHPWPTVPVLAGGSMYTKPQPIDTRVLSWHSVVLTAMWLSHISFVKHCNYNVPKQYIYLAAANPLLVGIITIMWAQVSLRVLNLAELVDPIALVLHGNESNTDIQDVILGHFYDT